jgi:hypothetical protein
MGIPGIQWESREYDGNPGNTMEIQGIRWESGEYDGNPGNTIKIQGILEILGIRNPPFPPRSFWIATKSKLPDETRKQGRNALWFARLTPIIRVSTVTAVFHLDPVVNLADYVTHL